jgi:hypothetical protein
MSLALFAVLAALAQGPVQATADIQVGGAGYRTAFDRAQRYEGEPASDAYRERELYPAVLADMKKLLVTCKDAGNAGDVKLTVVLAFDPDQDGPTLFLDRDTARGDCVVQGLAKLKFPKPPHPDFAEEIQFDFR